MHTSLLHMVWEILKSTTTIDNQRKYLVTGNHTYMFRWNADHTLSIRGEI